MRIVYLSSKLIAAVIVMGTLFGCQNAEQRAEEREKFGIKLFEQGEYKKAVLEFNSALKEKGTLATSYYYLALINEKNRRYQVMRENLVRAIALAPDNVDARVKLGRVNLVFNDLDAVLTEADAVLKLSKDNIDSVLLKAAVYIKQNKQGDALALIDGVLKKLPEHVEAISLKAMLLMQNERFDSALMLVNPIVDSGVDDISLHLLKIQLDNKQKDMAAVIVDYERLVKLYPDKKEFKFALAKIYSQANKKQDAENLLREMVKSDPLEIPYKLGLLDFLNSLDKNKALSQLDKYSVENQKNLDLLFNLAQWLAKKVYLPEAKDFLIKLDGMENSEKMDEPVKLLLAKVLLRSNEVNQAETLIDGVIQKNTENLEAKILKAKIHMALGRNEEAVKLLTKVLWANPGSDESLVLLAQIESSDGFAKKADLKYREALKVNPANMMALTSVVNNAIKEKDVDYATELVMNALRLKPNNLSLLRTLAEIKILSKDWEGAKDILESLEKQPGSSLLAKFLKGNLYREQGDCSQAVLVYKEILNISSDFPDALRQLAACHEIMEQRPQLIAYMTTFMEKNPENIVSYLIMGQLFTLEKAFEKADDIYQQALNINKKAPQIYAALAKNYSKQDKFDKAIETYKAGLKQNPGNVRLSVYIASAYQEVKDYKSAAAVYEAILAINPKVEIIINNYAALLVDYIADEKSLERARTLVKRFENSDNPFYLDSFAWTELKAGNINKAVALLEKVNIMAQIAVFKFHLGVAYHEQGNDSSAKIQLQQAIDLGIKAGEFAENKIAQQLLDKLTAASSSLGV